VITDTVTLVQRIRRRVEAAHDDPAESIRLAVTALAEDRPRWGWTGVYLLYGDELRLQTYVGPETDHTTIRVGSGVCGTAVAQGRNQVVADVRKRRDYLACSASTRSEIVVLIRHPRDPQRSLGQIDVDADALAEFGPEEERLLEQVAALLAPAATRLVGP
jgi:L-methionine (R)-S-oxide reductase